MSAGTARSVAHRSRLAATRRLCSNWQMSNPEDADGRTPLHASGGDSVDLQQYLDAQAAAGGHSTIPLSDLLRPFMSPAVRLRAKQVATAVSRPVSRRKARDEEVAGGLKLHLGSGGNNLAGWTNVDLVGARGGRGDGHDAADEGDREGHPSEPCMSPPRHRSLPRSAVWPCGRVAV